jgi:hypothetical protein
LWAIIKLEIAFLKNIQPDSVISVIIAMLQTVCTGINVALCRIFLPEVYVHHGTSPSQIVKR